jgi:hypothetical protein
MIEWDPVRPAYQVKIERSLWLRAEAAGILRFHVSPGELIEAGQPIATNVSVFGETQNTLRSPLDGIILGMTTLPAVKPGEPVCHLAIPSRSLRGVRRALERGRSSEFETTASTKLSTQATLEQDEG